MCNEARNTNFNQKTNTGGIGEHSSPQGGFCASASILPVIIMDNGFIFIWRKILETSFYRDSYALHLALHCIIKANHKETTITFNKKEITLKRGQFISGRHSLSDSTGIKPSTVRNKLELLKNIGFLDIKSDNNFSLITIVKYSDYQDSKQFRTALRTTKGQLKDTDNNDNNEKKVYKSNTKVSTDEEFLSSLRDNIAYKHINIPTELAKMDAWLLTRPGRKKTRRFIVNWLNKVEKPLAGGFHKP